MLQAELGETRAQTHLTSEQCRQLALERLDCLGHAVDLERLLVKEAHEHQNRVARVRQHAEKQYRLRGEHRQESFGHSPKSPSDGGIPGYEVARADHGVQIPHCNRHGLISVIETLLCIAEVCHNAGETLPLRLPFDFLLEDIRARPGIA